LLQSAPGDIVIASVGLLENTGWNPRSYLGFVNTWRQHGSAHFGDYTAHNPFNEYPILGPGHNIAKNIITRPNSHAWAVIHAMRRGGDLKRILHTVRVQERHGLNMTIAGAEYDGLSLPEVNRMAANMLHASRLVVANSVVWPGHYHPAMENLANARAANREIANY
jgi:hypothetical protein